MRSFNRPVLLAIALFFFVALPLGIIEGWYGRIDYSSDAIPYLDIARAVHDGNWKLAFNPLWGLGYPLLIAAIKPFFPATAAGEWNAVHLLNLFIYAADFAAFLFLLSGIRRAFVSWFKQEPEDQATTHIVLAGTALFLSTELCIDTVSRVGPDSLVTTLILLALGLLLRLIDTSRLSLAIALGATLGCGYVVKTIFLPFSLIIVLIAAAGLYHRMRKQFRPVLLVGIVAMAALFAIPNIAGLSRSFGRMTFGESGAVNYEWHVNRLNQMHWQGGPARYGKPLHPTIQLLADPPVYSFSEPFHVTYPPFFNPPYYYEGYRHFFSLKLQLRAIGAGLLHLFQALYVLPITYAVLICLVTIFVAGNMESAVTGREWLSQVQAMWPIMLPPIAGIALYLQVHLEGRYLPGFLLVLATTPIALFLLRSSKWPSFATPAVLATLILGSCATLLVTDRPTIKAALHNTRYSDGEQWILARFLVDHGLRPGDEVAFVAGPAAHCTWAHVDHLRIVTELAADLYAPEDTGKKMFWEATPESRQQMLDLFAGAGAKLVVAPATPSPMPGWTPVPGTDVAVHDLAPVS